MIATALPDVAEMVNGAAPHEPAIRIRPQVALVLPRYGDVSLGAAAGFFQPSDGKALDVPLQIEGATSATPHTFNHLLAIALNAFDEGTVTHFAMIHSDIAPKPGWLDVLWSEMERAGADVISAVVPIKEPARKRTSTAIGKLDDIWTPARYIEMGHRGLLPTTFTAADVCKGDEVLLVNTGLMLIDLRRPYWDGFAFEFRTRIDKVNGKRWAEFAPEDWLMSRHVQAHGGKVAATWAVPLIHHGTSEWSNGDGG